MIMEGLFSTASRLSLEVILNPPTRRKFDLDNRLKGILDALEFSKIIPNDEQFDSILILRGEIVKNGSAIIKISVIDMNQ